MTDLLTDLVAWMEGLSPFWIGVTVFVVAYLENVIPPVPGDVLVVFGGTLAGLGLIPLWLVIALATVAGTLGFMTMYAIGWKLDTAVLDAGRIRWLPRGPIHKAQRWLGRWGYGLVAANRFLSGARSVISLLVGASELKALPTAALAALSALVWTALIATGGYLLGDEWPRIAEYLKQYGQAVTALLVATGAGWLAVRAWTRRAAAGPPNDPTAPPEAEKETAKTG